MWTEILLSIIIFELLALILCLSVYITDARDELTKHITAIDDKLNIIMDNNLKERIEQNKKQ